MHVRRRRRRPSVPRRPRHRVWRLASPGRLRRRRRGGRRQAAFAAVAFFPPDAAVRSPRRTSSNDCPGAFAAGLRPWRRVCAERCPSANPRPAPAGPRRRGRRRDWPPIDPAAPRSARSSHPRRSARAWGFSSLGRPDERLLPGGSGLMPLRVSKLLKAWRWAASGVTSQ